MVDPDTHSTDLTDAKRLVEFRKSQIQLFQSYAGFVFILISAALFAAAIFFVLKFEHKTETQAEQGGLLVWLAQQVPQA